jgi:autotransporter-associated beta strand protein
MQVQGKVTPGTLVLSGAGMTFSGTATIRIVGKTAGGTSS